MPADASSARAALSANPANSASRRDFLRLGAAAAALPFPAAAAEPAGPREAREVRRYVALGRTGLEISDISFGSSSLRPGQESLVHLALERGINYFDTAESYTGGDAETVLGRALKGRRDRAILTSKVMTRADSSAAWLMQALESSLERLQTDYVDIFMNHAVNDVDVVRNPEWRIFRERAQRQGKIRFAGLSGHAGRLIECLGAAFDDDLADAILVAHNFGQDPKFYERLTRSLDFVATQQDLPRMLARAKQRNIGVTAMKTLRGARLNDMRPYEKGGATFAQAALRWVLSNPHVDGAVITMTSAEKIDEFLGASGWRGLARGDMQLLERYAWLNRAGYCRPACNDCEGSCPRGVPIAEVLRTRMYAVDYGDPAQAREEYALLARNAQACISCDGAPCAKACTHGVPIDRFCRPVHALLA